MSLRIVGAIEEPVLDKHHIEGWCYNAHFLFKSTGYYAGGPSAKRNFFLSHFLKVPRHELMCLDLTVGER